MVSGHLQAGFTDEPLTGSLQNDRLTLQSGSFKNDLARHHIKHPGRFGPSQENPLIPFEQGPFAETLNSLWEKSLQARGKNHLFHMM